MEVDNSSCACKCIERTPEGDIVNKVYSAKELEPQPLDAHLTENRVKIYKTTGG